LATLAFSPQQWLVPPQRRPALWQLPDTLLPNSLLNALLVRDGQVTRKPQNSGSPRSEGCNLYWACCILPCARSASFLCSGRARMPSFHTRRPVNSSRQKHIRQSEGPRSVVATFGVVVGAVSTNRQPTRPQRVPSHLPLPMRNGITLAIIVCRRGQWLATRLRSERNRAYAIMRGDVVGAPHQQPQKQYGCRPLFRGANLIKVRTRSSGTFSEG